MGEWLNELKYRLRLLFKRRQLEKDLQDELDFHLAMRQEHSDTSAGRRFGNVTLVQEDCREVWIFGALERFLADVRYAVRSLLKTPAVTLIAVISLALGIGSTTGIFSLFNRMLLKPLPVDDPSRLVNLGSPGPKPGSRSSGIAGNSDVVFSYPMFLDLERAQDVFTGIAAHMTFGANLAYHGETISTQGSMVSSSYFSVLGVRPALGRLLEPQDDSAPGQSPVVVLSHAYWKAHLAGNREVLNDRLIVNGQALTIVGIAPEGFEGTSLGSNPDVFVPITLSGQLGQTSEFNDRQSYWIYLFARLKPGVSIEQARQKINVPYHAILKDVEAPLQTELPAATLERFKTRQLTLEEGAVGQSVIRGKIRTPLEFLLAVTGLVLLIACANIANLLLARSAARSGEMAIRLSIGAGRLQLIAQLLTEASLLSLLGGGAGLFAVRWTVDLLAANLPSNPFTTDILAKQPDANVLIFATAVTIVTTVLFGLLPALYSTRPDLLSVLKGQTGQPDGARSAARFRSGLATFQIALSLVLLFTAGLFTRSLFNVSKVDLGLKTDKLITFTVSPDQNGYSSLRSREFFARLEDDLRRQPGVSTVTASRVPLLGKGGMGQVVAVEGFTPGPEDDTASRYNEVGPGYFNALGISLIAGREFTEFDAIGTAKVAVVNEQFVKKFRLGKNPVGKYLGDNGGHSDLDVEIVGVVQDSKYSEVREGIPPVFFRPFRQDSTVGSMTFYVRASSEPDKVLAMAQPTIARIDPNLPVEELRTMEEVVRNNLVDDRILGVLSVAFASLATVLAAIGLYGVMAYTVTQRIREFGLRMALGANPAQVQALVLRQVGWMTAIGGAVGLVGAMAVGRAAQSMLFELNGHDPLVLLASTVVLSAIALAAGFIPAYRASKVDPMRALRHD